MKFEAPRNENLKRTFCYGDGFRDEGNKEIRQVCAVYLLSRKGTPYITFRVALFDRFALVGTRLSACDPEREL